MQNEKNYIKLEVYYNSLRKMGLLLAKQISQGNILGENNEFLVMNGIGNEKIW